MVIAQDGNEFLQRTDGLPYLYQNCTIAAAKVIFLRMRDHNITESYITVI